jgi:hypothetical protein
MDVPEQPDQVKPSDTLIKFDYAAVSVNPIAFLRDKIKVNRFSFVNPEIYALVTSEGKVNWDILKSTEKDTDTVSSPTQSEGLKASIDLNDISIVNGILMFDDRYTDNFLSIRGFEMNLEATYNEKEVLLDVDLNSQEIDFHKEEGLFTDPLSIDLATKFKVDRKSKKINIPEAQVSLNDLVFDAKGAMRHHKLEKEIEMDLDLNLNVPTLNTLIDLVPETVFDKSQKYKVDGQALFDTKIKGVYKKGQVPDIQGKFLIKDGSVSYDNKPDQIELIKLNADFHIPQDKREPSNFNIKNLRIKGAGTDFNLEGSGTDIFGQCNLNLSFDGKVDLDGFEKTLPFKKDIDLGGNAEASLRTDFNLSDIVKKDFSRLQALGKLRIDQLLYDNKSDSLHIEMSYLDFISGQDLNSELLTENKTRVFGGKIDMEGLNFTQGRNSKGSLNQFNAKFTSTSLKDSNQVGTLKAAILIDDGRVILGDTLRAKLKFLKGDFALSPKSGAADTPEIISSFEVDSIGAIFKGKKVALVQARYNLKATRDGNNWPLDGDISFGTMYAFSPRFPLQIQIPKTEILLSPGYIELNHAKLLIGQSDITATGRLYDFGDAFFDNKLFKGELEVSSELIDINEMIQALNAGNSLSGEQEAPTVNEEVQMTALNDEINQTSESPRLFVIPKNLDLRLESNFKKVLYKKFVIDNTIGLITVKDQKIDLANLQMTTFAANMRTSLAYSSLQKGKATMDFDFMLYDIDLAKLTELMPVIDSLLPMAESFEGKVNFRMKGASALDQSLGMVGPTLDAIARVEGDDLVILDGETFQKISRMLLFKNKDKNTIDKLEFAMVFKDETILIFPSVITVDRYKVAIGGQHKLDMTYDYHVSILKSPMPFKAGIDITGTKDDMGFKITKAKYKRLFSTKERQRKKADTTILTRKNTVIKRLPFPKL